MVTPYVPEAGDIVMMDFDPQVGREQAKAAPCLGAHRSAVQPGKRVGNRLSADQQTQTLSVRTARHN
jgi:hypothetical protein